MKVGDMRYDGIRGIRFSDFLPRWAVCFKATSKSTSLKIYNNKKEAEEYV